MKCVSFWSSVPWIGVFTAWRAEAAVKQSFQAGYKSLRSFRILWHFGNLCWSEFKYCNICWNIPSAIIRTGCADATPVKKAWQVRRRQVILTAVYQSSTPTVCIKFTQHSQVLSWCSKDSLINSWWVLDIQPLLCEMHTFNRARFVQWVIKNMCIEPVNAVSLCNCQ